MLADFVTEKKVELAVYIDLDADYHRTGVDPNGAGMMLANDLNHLLGEDIITMAQIITRAPLLALHGLYVHGGQAYGALSSNAVRSISEQECKTGDAYVFRVQRTLISHC